MGRLIVATALVAAVLSTCTGQGYTQISLAVMQKGAEAAAS